MVLAGGALLNLLLTPRLDLLLQPSEVRDLWIMVEHQHE